ncbi:thioredoxin fold domain-containing protein [Stenotrophomonas sp.]|uniref:thioredoxin fold domain-containing protein n=1 Tax=Stenotrophomonas sp. TaxID=69392 RepID=UPI00289F36C2|nr:thioredoxin fold domain-containing protein [Stenotrophomonas sp.]
MLRVIAVALLGALSLTACAQPTAPAARSSTMPAAAAPAAGAVSPAEAEKTVRAALQSLNPKFQVDFIGAAPFPGFREVLVGGQVLYVSDDGRYLVQDQPYDIQARRPASSTALLGYRKQKLDGIAKGDRIIFAAANPKHTITVFTDIECGYCRKLHQDVPELNRMGITVEYVAFPRMGLGSQDYTDMISVWCAVDRRKALTSAKEGAAVTPKNCTNPVAMQYTLGQQIGVSGTPAIFAADGTQLGGYIAPAQMKAALEKLAL